MYKQEQQNYIYIKINKNKNIKNKSNYFLKLFLIFTLVLTFITIFVQLFVTSKFSTKGEEISYLEKRKNELILENIKIKSEIANTNNLEVLRQNASKFGFVPLDQKEVKYLSVD